MKLANYIMLLLAFSFSSIASDTRYSLWKKDIEFIKNNIVELHIDPFSKISKQEFYLTLDKIDIHKNTDEQITLEISKAISLLKDGHSFVEGLQPLLETFMQTDLFFPSLPIRFKWLEEGIFVTETTNKHKKLLGYRLLSVNGVSAESLALQAADYFPAENGYGEKYWGVRAVSIPEILTHLTGQKTFRFIFLSEQEEMEIMFSPEDVSGMPEAPFGINVDFSWSAIDSGVEKPLYLQSPKDIFQTASFGDVLYIQIKSMNEEKPNTISAEKFLCNELSSVQGSKQTNLVLDLRFNIGGETDYLNSMVKCVAASKYNKPNKLHIIVGERTFSAGQLFAVWLKEFTYAKFYGEQTPMQTHFYSNTRPSMTLPNSKLTIFLSTLFWQPTHMYRNENTFRPDRVIGYSINDLKDGTDPMLEGILKEL